MLAKNWIFTIIFFLIQLFSNGDGARILATFPYTGKSHMFFFNALLQELARRGHDVTVMSPFKSDKKIENFHEITSQLNLSITNTFNIREETKGLKYFQLINEFSEHFCRRSFEVPELQPYIRGEKPIDLFISESHFSECHLGFLHVYKDVPFIQMVSFLGWNFMLEPYGNPTEIATVPAPILPYSQEMTFTERFRNYVTTIIWRLFRDFIHIPNHQQLLYEYFGPNVPSIKTLEKRSSLLFMNVDPVLGYSRALSKNIIPIGGIHIGTKLDPLPDDLKKWLDAATDGVIYFSLGTNVQSIDLPDEIKENLIKSFGKLKQRVLMKWENTSMANKPENIKIEKWLPQKDLLAHPKINAFVTHGGLQSVQEAIFHGVPVIGIPLMTDQYMVMRRAVDKQFGIMMEVENITEQSMSWALNEINNPLYKSKAKHYSILFRDQPINPLENAVFWTEYVIRHKGARNLDNPARNLSWFQKELLDVYLLAFLLIAIPLFFVLCIIECCYNWYRYREARKLLFKKDKRE